MLFQAATIQYDMTIDAYEKDRQKELDRVEDLLKTKGWYFVVNSILCICSKLITVAFS